MQQLQANGITLAYEDQGAGHPLVLISGLGYGAWFWRKLTGPLSDHFRVITFDNRGVGDSEKATGPYSTALLAADTIGLIRALGLDEVYLLGHSLRQCRPVSRQNSGRSGQDPAGSGPYVPDRRSGLDGADDPEFPAT